MNPGHDLLSLRALAQHQAVYKLAGGNLAQRADSGPLTLDRRRLTATGVISTAGRDRSGDVVITQGIDLTSHQKNPCVLLEHQVPIGQAMDPAGVYTVRLEQNQASATTFFSQSSLEAQQAFQLIDEGVLRGLSIAFKPLEFNQLADQPGNWFPPMKFLRVELLEYSHTVLPDNPDALLSAVGKRYGGKALTGALRKSLLAHCPPRALAVSVPELPRSMNRNKAAAGDDYVEMPEEASGGREPPEEERDLVPPPLENPGRQQGPEMKQSDGPPGAEFLMGCYERLMELGSYLGEMGGTRRQENPAVLAWVEEMGGRLEEMAADMGTLFSKEYPDLEGPGDRDQPDQAEPGDDSNPEGTEDDDDRPPPEMGGKHLLSRRTGAWETRLARQKRMSKARIATCSKAGDYLDEIADHEGALRPSQKSAATYHAAQLRGITTSPDDSQESDSKRVRAAEEKAAQAEAELERVRQSAEHHLHELTQRYEKLERAFRRARAGY